MAVSYKHTSSYYVDKYVKIKFVDEAVDRLYEGYVVCNVEGNGICLQFKGVDGFYHHKAFYLATLDSIEVIDDPAKPQTNSTARDEILDKAKSIINGERQGTYGAAEDSFAVIPQLWSAYLGREVSSADVANLMILMKVARNHSGVYKDDNWIDICGYAALGGEIQASYKNE